VQEKDLILLDAILLDKLSMRAFRAKLDNGHVFVVHGGHGDADVPLSVGDRVRVELSPFDMSTGRLLMEC
jgi:translation initiation factor IF-1